MILTIIYILLALIIGILAGTFTGLIPGIHINLIAVSLITVSAFFLQYVPPSILIVFIVAMSITHTFLDFIPSIFLGAPDEDSVLSILPGHNMLLKRKGQHAVLLTLIGSSLAIIILLILSIPTIFYIYHIYPYIHIVIPYLLILISIFMIINDKARIPALIVFLLAGFLGISVFSLSIRNPIFPLLTGLFGSSALITSILKKQKIPKQEIINLKIRKTKNKLKNIKNKIHIFFSQLRLKKKDLIKPGIGALIAAPFSTLLPGVGASQAAIIGNEIIGEMKENQFLILLGAINTIVAGFSFLILYTIGKTRTGAAVAVSTLSTLTLSSILLILVIILISSLCSFFITFYLSGWFSKKIGRFNYRKISLGILCFLALLSIIFSGFLGLLIFLIATFLGLFSIKIGVRRTQLMGCLILYTILLYVL